MRVAVLGVGEMGRTVIQHLQSIDLVEKIVAYDIRQESLCQIGNSAKVVLSRDIADILSDSRISLAFVNASTAAHKDLTIQCLRAGKAVMCEKPMATNLTDSTEMVEAAERLGAFLQIGFELRYSKLYTTIKEWIDAGRLGNVINTHACYICSELHGKRSWRNNKNTAGGMFLEKLCHYVDLPRWWISDQVKDVYSVCAPNVVQYCEVRDNYHTVYRFRNGAVSELTFMMAPAATFDGDPLQNMLDQQKDDGHALRYFIQGTKGAAATDVFRRDIKRWEFGDFAERMTSTLAEVLTWDSSEDHFYFHNTFDQTKDMVERVANNLPPMTPARDSLESMKISFTSELSAEAGRVINIEEDLGSTPEKLVAKQRFASRYLEV